MQLNMSEELVQVVINSLNCSKQTLKRQLAKANDDNKAEIIRSQLNDVLWALDVFEEGD